MSARHLLLIAAVLWAASAGEVRAQSCNQPCVGPPRGAIIAAGGGEMGLEVYEKFVELAGGPDAKIVLIPTAGARYGSHDGWTAIEELQLAGVEQLEVLPHPSGVDRLREDDVAPLDVPA